MPKKKLYGSTKKKSEEKTKAQEWIEKIQRAIKVKEKWREEFRVALGYDYWEGRQRPGHIPAREWVTINLIYSNLLALLPSLYNMNPFFYIKLKRSYDPHPLMVAMYEQKAKIRQAMINYLKDELNLKPKVRLSIFDAFFQFGVAKVHYYSEMVENPDKEKPILNENEEAMLDEKGNPLIEPNEIPASEAYKLTRIHPDDFVVDEDAGPLDEDVNWKAQRIKAKIKDIRDDKRFDATARKEVKATEISDEIQKQREQRKKGSVYESSNKAEDADVCVYWEVYDIKNEEFFAVSEGYTDYLINPGPIPKGIERDPFVDLRFTMRDDSWYPIPPVSQWIDPQREYCELRSKLATHRKRFNRKYQVYKPGLVDETELTKLEIGDDGTIIQTAQPGQVVTPIQDAPLDQTHIQEIAMLRDELTLLSIGPNQAGSGRGVESATEADIIEQRLRVQEGDWVGLVAEFAKTIARKQDQLIQEHLSQNQAIRVTGPQGEYWELVKTDDYQAINGEYEYDINVGTMVPKLPEIERAQWTAVLNLFSGFPHLMLSKRLVMKMAEMHHIDDEQMVNELYQIAQQIMSGQLPMPGTQGSTPGSSALPGAIAGGMASGMANMRGGP